MSTTERGRAAEVAAATYLEDLGLTIVERNWRSRWHEVDLIARSQAGWHIIEVRYRHETSHGSGFETISRDKANRLRRAALAWVQRQRYEGSYQIDIVSVSGPLDHLAIDYLPNAITD